MYIFSDVQLFFVFFGVFRSMVVRVGVCVCGCVWVAHTSKVKTKKLRFFRICKNKHS